MTEPTAPWTVLRLINWTRDYLGRAEIDEPRLAAEVLLAHVLKCRRIELYTRFDHQPTAEELATYRELVRRAREHEPVAYLVGEKEFYSLKFKVNHDVLIPRPETERLVELALDYVRDLGRAATMWDCCTGSGCVAVATAVNAPKVTVLATDISPGAIAVAAQNAALHKVGDRVRCRVADMLTLPNDCQDLHYFDVITANPPYIAKGEKVAETVRREPEIALYGGKEGLDFVARLIADAAKMLRGAGVLIFEFGFGQGDDVRELLLDTGDFDEPRIFCDHQGIERALIASRILPADETPLG